MSREATPEPTSEERWALLNRVAASPQLRRSNRLRDFLLFVGTQSIQMGVTDISEQMIGISVFGRASSYDTSLDNIVRVNASELRKRIKSYFDEDGSAETLVLDIPRGSYAPVFHWRESTSVAATEPVPTTPAEIIPERQREPAPPAPTSTNYRGALALGALALLLLVACGALLLQNRRMDAQMHPWRGEPALQAFWSNFLTGSHGADIVLADATFALTQDVLHRTITLNQYLNYSYRRMGQYDDVSADRLADLELVLQRNNGSIGDFRVAHRIMDLDHSPGVTQLWFARDYTTEFLKRDATVLLGSRKSNPWVDLFDTQLEFNVAAAPDRSQSYVEVRHPRPGEPTRLTASADPTAVVGYCAIAYLPNLSHTGNLLIIAGTDSQATEAAGEFMTTESSLAGFLGKLPKPIPYFQLLLKTSRLNGTPISSEIVTYRISPR